MRSTESVGVVIQVKAIAVGIEAATINFITQDFIVGGCAGISAIQVDGSNGIGKLAVGNLACTHAWGTRSNMLNAAGIGRECAVVCINIDFTRGRINSITRTGIKAALA